MITLFCIFTAVLLLDLVAVRWGVDSSDGITSPEWKRRQDWSIYH
jgi:hypothetical protein